jgi:hypothetical protein
VHETIRARRFRRLATTTFFFSLRRQATSPPPESKQTPPPPPPPPASVPYSSKRAPAFPNPCRQPLLHSLAHACHRHHALMWCCGGSEWWRLLRSMVDSLTDQAGHHHPRAQKAVPFPPPKSAFSPTREPRHQRCRCSLVRTRALAHQRGAFICSAGVDGCHHYRCCWVCSIGGRHRLEGARRRGGDYSRDEFRWQQLRRIWYVWFDLGLQFCW